MCAEFPCKKYAGADLYDSFITHKNQFVDLEKAKKRLGVYQSGLNEKTSLLAKLLKNYDDGRRKSFFCLAVNLLDLQSVRSVVKKLAKLAEDSPKLKAETAAHLLNEAAEKKGISLKLRKKAKS